MSRKQKSHLETPFFSWCMLILFLLLLFSLLKLIEPHSIALSPYFDLSNFLSKLPHWLAFILDYSFFSILLTFTIVPIFIFILNLILVEPDRSIPAQQPRLLSLLRLPFTFYNNDLKDLSYVCPMIDKFPQKSLIVGFRPIPRYRSFGRSKSTQKIT
jgi:hypothetical protein